MSVNPPIKTLAIADSLSNISLSYGMSLTWGKKRTVNMINALVPMDQNKNDLRLSLKVFRKTLLSIRINLSVIR